MAKTANKQTKKTPRKPKYDYDFFVIGAGSGGMTAAATASRLGAKVAVAEERYMGGTCVNAGCVPKKLMSYAAKFAQDFADAAGFGWQGKKPRLSWKKMIAGKNAEIAKLNKYWREDIDDKNIDLFEGDKATFVDEHTIRLGNKTVTADKILIATGSWPVKPKIPGHEHAITSNEIFHLKDKPKRTIIIGGGYIGMEFAGILNGLGSKVTLINRDKEPLAPFDQDIRSAVSDAMKGRGVDLRNETNVTSLRKTATGIEATLDDGSTIEADQVLFATGRAALTDGMDLHNAGVKTGKNGAVTVDSGFKSSADNIYAIGDVTDTIKLTPVAIAEGRAMAKNAFGGAHEKVDYTNIPTAVFTTPTIGSVGLTEKKALETYGDIDVYKTSFTPMQNTMAGRDEKTMMKLVVDHKSDRVVGAHMVGPDAPEIIQSLAVAIKSGATKADFDNTIAIHPTAAEEFVLMRRGQRKQQQPGKRAPAP